MLTVEKIGDVLIISFNDIDKLNVVVAQSIKSEANALVSEPNIKVILNLGALKYIDSSGFGVLLSILRICKSNNSQLRLCNINSEIMEVVKLLQLQTVFDIKGSVNECLASLAN
ncbi:MAG: STAS domain-containing protein [Bacteroidales bacterium]|nr:STAS domain-containing protein [Bacteroidales bacterium]MBN2750907.1 STAS domain-containing protein [Bacteroidales bacterium]